MPLLHPAPTVQYRFHRVDANFGLFDRPMEAGPDGNIWFGAGNSQNQTELGRLAPDGSIKYFAITGSTSFVVALGVGPNGTVTFGLYSGAIGEMKTDGTLKFLYSVPSGAPIVGNSLTSDSSGNIFYGTLTNSQIGITRVSQAGKFKIFQCSLQACNYHYIQGVVRGADSNYWFTYSYSSPEGAGRMTPAGVFTLFGLDGHYPPGPPVLGPDGNIWFMDNNQGQYSEVVSITPSGGVTYNRVPSNYQFTIAGSIAAAPGMLWFDSSSQLGRFATQGSFLPFLYPPPQPSSPGIFMGSVAIGGDGNAYVVQADRQIMEVVMPTAQQPIKVW